MNPPKEPRLPENPTLEDLEDYHRQIRQWNTYRIAHGLATAEEIRRENSWLIPEGVKAKIDWSYVSER